MLGLGFGFGLMELGFWLGLEQTKNTGPIWASASGTQPMYKQCIGIKKNGINNV